MRIRPPAVEIVVAQVELMVIDAANDWLDPFLHHHVKQGLRIRAKRSGQKICRGFVEFVVSHAFSFLGDFLGNHLIERSRLLFVGKGADLIDFDPQRPFAQDKRERFAPVNLA